MTVWEAFEMVYGSCLRTTGAPRAFFETAQAAQEAIETWPGYRDDVVTFCSRCGKFHCSHPDWLADKPWETVATELIVQ